MLRSDSITVAVLWPRGPSILVRIPPNEQVKAVLDIVYKDKDCNFYPFVFHKGRLLNLSLSLSFQGIRNNDSLVLYEHPSMWLEDPEPETSFDANVYSVMSEAIAVSDRVYRQFEGSYDAGKVLRLLGGSRPSIDYDHEETPLVIPEKSDHISTEPLPMLVQDEEEEETEFTGVPTFESIEEAGKFFTKYPFDAWSW